MNSVTHHLSSDVSGIVAAESHARGHSPPPPASPGGDLDCPGYEIASRPVELFREYLDSMDWSIGMTKHIQTFHALLRAASLGIDPVIAIREVIQRIERVGGIVDRWQVQRQQERALQYVSGITPGSSRRTLKVPKITYDAKALARVAGPLSAICPITILRAKSLVPPESVTPIKFLEALFNGGELVLIFTELRSQGQALHRAGSGHESAIPQIGPSGVWFLAQPVDGEYQRNAEGKRSRRSEPSVTSWPHLVLESDQADASDWLRAVLQIPLPIVAIYSSGGRSIHCLVRVGAKSKAEWDQYRDRIKPIVVKLGADPAALTAVRLTRLPGCWRGDRRQELLYLNPAADGTPIIRMPVATSCSVGSEGGPNVRS